MTFPEYIAAADPEVADGLCDALFNSPPSLAIRTNPAKLSPGESPSILPPGAGQVPWNPDGFYLADRPDFTLDPALHQGLYYVQDASSQIIGPVVTALAGRLFSAGLPPSALKYLDVCAAPGGKTTAAIAALPPEAFVLANEFDFRRADILCENILKWGAPSVAVARGDTARLASLSGFFHIIAADVPCSGEGMMRKDPTARSQWSEALVNQCTALQREILTNLWPALAPGGFLIYSTCTFNPLENEQNIAWAVQNLGAIPIPVTPAPPSPSPTSGDSKDFKDLNVLKDLNDPNVPDVLKDPDSLTLPIPLPGVMLRNGFMRFLPGRIRGEGLFMAVLQKPGILPSHERSDMPSACQPRAVRPSKNPHDKGKTTPSPSLPRQAADTVASWLNTPCRLYLNPSGEIFAMPLSHAPALDLLNRHLSSSLILPGTHVATLKGNAPLPAQGLALSPLLSPSAFPTHPLDTFTPDPLNPPTPSLPLSQALAYLRRESLSAFPAPRGPLLLTFNNHPLGFVNNLPNRANNLYPLNWRIRKQ